MTRSPFARPLLAVLAAAPAVALGLAAPAALADQPHAWGLWTQEPASPIMDQIESLHNAISIIILLITLLVFGLMVYIFVRFNAKAHPVPSRTTHNTPIEVLWTAIPIVILVGIAFPSFRLLYAQDKLADAKVTLKVTGHQWYWSYAFPDEKVSFDANLVQDADLKSDQPRLLATDNPVELPINVGIRILVTADDVIHAWSVPALGVKTDAVPGRLNEIWTRIEREGTYYGQCSQLCGVNHGYMPIEVKGVTEAEFRAWLDKKKAGAKTSQAEGPALAQAEFQR